jgi:hypothetical protein
MNHTTNQQPPTPHPVSFTEWNREQLARTLKREPRTYHAAIRTGRQGAEGVRNYWRDYVEWCTQEGHTPTP